MFSETCCDMITIDELCELLMIGKNTVYHDVRVKTFDKNCDFFIGLNFEP